MKKFNVMYPGQKPTHLVFHPNTKETVPAFFDKVNGWWCMSDDWGFERNSVVVVSEIKKTFREKVEAFADAKRPYHKPFESIVSNFRLEAQDEDPFYLNDGRPSKKMFEEYRESIEDGKQIFLVGIVYSWDREYKEYEPTDESVMMDLGIS